VDLVVFFGIYMTLAPLSRATTGQNLDLLELTLSEPALVGKIVSPLSARRVCSWASEKKQAADKLGTDGSIRQ